MKRICYLLGVVCLLMSSCTHHNDGPQSETRLPIEEIFTPAGMWIEESDADAPFFQDISRKLFVVNSADELPDDRLGFSDTYKKADFKNYTMLIYYQLHRWEFESCQYLYLRLNLERKFSWTITMKVAADEDTYPGMRCISRFAIMVNKIPDGWDVTATFGLSDYNWSWEE
ncbi:MAG: hypothetical protein HDR88_06415 [Bacteroides sp.]|nr:hypothetical protein [Bacteroides sp.]